MDRTILGDNQFFGVSHMSEERGIERAIRFQDDQAIIDLIDAAYDAGIHAVSFSTHDRVSTLCDYFRANKGKYSDIRFYVTIPYAYKYADLVNEKGIMGAVRDVLFKNSSPAQAARMASNFGAVILKQDPKDLMRVLIDAELTMFTRLGLEVVFLQNIIADLILGLGWNELFKDFNDYVESKYHVRAGFITTNLPRMVNALLDAGIKRPLVCSAINMIGAQMSPDIESYKKCLTEKKFDAIAMTFMAGGAVAPDVALKWLSQFKNIQAVIFGASSLSHIKQTRDLISEFLFRD